MKERLSVPYRNIVVCYHNNTCIGWRTPKEFKAIFDTGEVNWYEIKTKKGSISFNEEQVKEQYERKLRKL
jgi:hypothetical protein